MPGLLALPVASRQASAVTAEKIGKLPRSPQATLPGTLLPMTGRAGKMNEILQHELSAPEVAESSCNTSRGLDIKALIPQNIDAEVSKRYDFGERELGFGGFGKVFLATDRESKDRLVAIKKVVMLSSEMREVFQQEVLIMKQLDHPNICRIFESYDQGRFVYLVMEYCEGGDLLSYLQKREALDERQAACIIQQVASALRHAHCHGICHRDLKPENVCLSSVDLQHPQVKVIDWGLGCHFRRSRMKSAVGSSAYAAPEILQLRHGGSYTSACDLWGLGAVACVLLSGQPPVCSSSRESGSLASLSEPVWSSVSREGRRFVQSLLQNDPEQRPSIKTLLDHPWLNMQSYEHCASLAVAKQVLANLRRFSNLSDFLSLCSASLAHQLTISPLDSMYRVFQELDDNGDGVLELREVRDGFEKILGVDSPELEDIDGMFSKLDLDGSGAIDYTEFCAACLEKRMCGQVEALWGAFKAFDVYDSDGRISEDEIAFVLADAGRGNWSLETCKRLAHEAVERFDRDGNGLIDFEEWTQMMNEHVVDDCPVK